MKFVDVLRPRYVVLENVPLYRNHPSYKEIVAALTAMGYVHDQRVVDAARYGVPSSRKRLVARFSRVGPLRPFPKPGVLTPWMPAIVDLMPAFPVASLAPWQRARVERLLERGARIRFPWLVSSNNVPTAAFASGQAVRVARGADEPAFTVVSTAGAMTQTRVLQETGRVTQLTARAFARLMSFPDEYELPESTKVAIRIVGNAVPPMLSRTVLESL